MGQELIIWKWIWSMIVGTVRLFFMPLMADGAKDKAKREELDRWAKANKEGS
jgi:hypothetical protein